MNSYVIVKFFHVLAVIVWVGGTCLFAFMAAVLSRDAASMRALGVGGIAAGRFLLMPGSIITLLTGLIMMMQLGGHPPFWMLWGLVAGPGSGIIGGVFIRKTGMALAAEMGAGGDTAKADALRKRLQALTLINVTLMVSAVATMVIKP